MMRDYNKTLFVLGSEIKRARIWITLLKNMLNDNSVCNLMLKLFCLTFVSRQFLTLEDKDYTPFS